MKICSVCQTCYEDVVAACAHDDHGELIASRPGTRKISAKYRLDVLLERSLTGETYQATDVNSNKSFVIKLIDPNLTGDLMLVRESFNTEVRAATEINHPNAVRVVDHGVLGNSEFYIVTEITDGQTLREYLTDAGSLSEATAITIARQAAEALELAHSLGIIHRNLSPANILIAADKQGQPLIKLRNFDFGGIMQRVVTANALDTKLYLEAFRYFSPEQCARQTVDARSDIYSLGMVLYEMLSGELLFDATTRIAIVNKKNNEQLPPLNHLHFDVKALLTHALMRALNKRADLRQQSANGFARNLRHLEYITKQSSTIFKKPLVNQLVKITEARVEEAVPNTTAPPQPALLLNNSLPAAEQEETVFETSIPIAKAAVAAASNQSNSPSIVELIAAARQVSNPIFDSEPVSVQKKNSSVTADASEPVLVKRKNSEMPLSADDAVVSKTQNADETALFVAPASVITPFAESSVQTPTNLASSNLQDSFDNEAPSPKFLRHKRPFINAGYIAICVAAVAILGAILIASSMRSRQQAEQQQQQQQQAGANALPSANSVSGEPISVVNAAQDKAADLSNEKVVASTPIEKQDSAASVHNNKNEPRENILTGDGKAKQNSLPKDKTEAEKSLVVEPNKDNQSLETTKSGDSQAELGTSFNKWIEATNSRDVDQQMNYYAPKVNSYYLSRNASQEAVKAEKKRVFENAAVVDIKTSKPEITVSDNGQSAKMRFRKKYVIKKGQEDHSGEVIQELQWVKSKNGWKIVSERDVKVVNR